MSAGLSAAAIGGIAAGVGAIGSAVISGNAAQSAANTQAQAANNATQAQLQMFNTTQGNLQPYMQAGQTGLNTLTGDLQSLINPMSNPMGVMPSINNSNWTQYMSPAYNFQLQQGQQALQNSQAASDGALSGAAMKGLIGYNQQMAGTAFQNAFNDYQTQYTNQFNQGQSIFNNQMLNNQNIYSHLSNLANLGENAAANVGQNATQTGQGMANTIQAAGNAQAAGTVGTSNAISGGLNNGMGYLMLNGMSNGNLFGSSSNADYGVPGWTPSGS